MKKKKDLYTMNEMDLYIQQNHYFFLTKILEIQKCYSMALMPTFSIP